MKERIAPTSAPRTSARRFELLVGGAAFVAYLRSLAFGFLLDDTTVIRSNPQIQSWSALAHAFGQPYWGVGGAGSGLYRPVFVSIVGVLWNLSNHAPFWFHSLAVTLHVVATIAVWRVAARAVDPWPATVGALWFAVQPVHVEAIASVANSSEIIVALLALALAVMFARAATRNANPSWRFAFGTALLFAAACLVKESGAMTPVLALIVALFWRRPDADHAAVADSDDDRLSRGAVSVGRWWRVGIALGAALAVVAVTRIAVLGALVPATIAAPGLAGLSFTQRAWAMLSLGPVALHALGTPRMLNPHYGPSYIAGATTMTTSAIITLGLIVVAGAIALLLAQRRDTRPLAGILWMLVAFLPASNLLSPTGQIFAERTLYVSTVGSAFIVSWVAERVLAHARDLPMPDIVSVAGGGVVAVVLLVAFARTEAGLRAWRSHPALFTAMIAADSQSYRGYWLRGLDQRGRRQTDSALADLAHAYKLFPNDRQLLIDYAETLRSTQRDRDAAAIAAKLMRWPELRRNADALSLYLDEVGRAFGPDSVRVASERLFTSDPTSTSARFLGDARMILGDTAGARDAYRRGLALAPYDSTLARRLNPTR